MSAEILFFFIYILAELLRLFGDKNLSVVKDIMWPNEPRYVSKHLRFIVEQLRRISLISRLNFLGIWLGEFGWNRTDFCGVSDL